MPSFTHGHALRIGVGGDLPNTVTNAQEVAKLLTDPEGCVYPPDQVACLTGGAARWEGVLAALDAWANRITLQDTVIVYLSGHVYQGESGGIDPGTPLLSPTGRLRSSVTSPDLHPRPRVSSTDG